VLLPVDPATAAASEAANACAVDASAPVSQGSSSSIASSNIMVLVQLHVLQGGQVRVQLVVPCASDSDPAAATAAAAAAKQPLRMDTAADAAAAAAANRDMAAGQPTHYTPTIGKGQLVTGCWDSADVHQQRAHLAVAQQALWLIAPICTASSYEPAVDEHTCSHPYIDATCCVADNSTP
jgi:hypothetical protein